MSRRLPWLLFFVDAVAAADLDLPNCTYQSCPVCLESRPRRNLTFAVPGEAGYEFASGPFRIARSLEGWPTQGLLGTALGILVQEKLGIEVEYDNCTDQAPCYHNLTSCAFKGSRGPGPCVPGAHVELMGWPLDEVGLSWDGISRGGRIVPLGALGWYPRYNLYVMQHIVDVAWDTRRVVLSSYSSFTGGSPVPAHSFLQKPVEWERIGQQFFKRSPNQPCPGPNSKSNQTAEVFGRAGFVCRNGWWLTPACAALGAAWVYACVAVLQDIYFSTTIGRFDDLVRAMVDTSMVVAVCFDPAPLGAFGNCASHGLCFAYLSVSTAVDIVSAMFMPVRVAFPTRLDEKNEAKAIMKRGWEPAVVANEALRIMLRKIQAEPAVFGSMSAVLRQRIMRPGLVGLFEPSSFQKMMCDWLRSHEPVWRRWLPSSRACILGDVFSEELQACQPCLGGKFFSDDIPTPSCRNCPRGACSTDVRSTECARCAAGFHQHLEGQTHCRACGPGSYQDAQGASACLACPAGLTTDEPGALGAAACACPERTYLTLAGRCEACPSGMSCRRGAAEQLPGHFAEVVDASVPVFSVYRCRSAEECPGGPPASCAPGRTGLACAECLPGRFRAHGGACLPCNGGDRAGLLVGLVCAAATAVALPLVARFSISTRSLVSVTVITTGGQVAGAVQTLTALQHLKVEWTGATGSLMAAIQVASFDFEVLRVGCLTAGGSSSTVSLALTLGLYPCLAAFMLAGWALSHFRDRRMPWRQFFSLNGTLLYSVFIGLTVALLRPFQCRSNPNGRRTMASDPQVICWDQGAHARLVALSVIGVAVYPVSLVSLALWQTLRYPLQIAAGHGLLVNEKYSFLFSRFRVERYFYGCAILLRSFIVSLVPVLLVDVGVLPLVIIGAVMVAATSLSATCWPWRTPFTNASELCICTALVLLFLSAIPLMEASGEDAVLGPLLFSKFVAMLLVGLLVVIHSALRRLRGPGAYCAFLCHDKACSGVLCRLLKMTIQGRRSACRVFLDADSLQDPDMLFDTVRCSTRNLVVILSPRLLQQAWRAGEIATAHANGVPLVPVACAGLQTPNRLEAIAGAWTEEEAHMLLRFGITAADIQEAYNSLLELDCVVMPHPNSGVEHESAVETLLGRCGLRGGFRLPELLRVTSWKLEDGSRVCVSGHSGDVEAACMCRVVQAMLRRDMQEGVQLACSLEELGATAETLGHWVVLFTRGILETPQFAQMILYLVESRPSLAVTTVVADPSFEFPGDDFYSRLETNGLGLPGLGSEEGMVLSDAYRALMQVLAKPLSPLGSEGLLQRQVQEIHSRICSRDLASAAAPEYNILAEPSQRPVRAAASGPADPSALGVEDAEEAVPRAVPATQMFRCGAVRRVMI